MGFFTTVTQSVQATVHTVIQNPLSTNGALALLSGGASVPFNNSKPANILTRPISKDFIVGQAQQAYNAATNNKVFRYGEKIGQTKVGSVLFPFLSVTTKKGRKRFGTGNATIGIIAVVVVVCIYSFGGWCGPAVAAGAAGLTAVNAPSKQKPPGGAGSTGGAPINGFDGSAGGGAGGSADPSQAVSDLAQGDFSGVGSSVDPNTIAGQKTLIVGATILGLATSALALYFLLRKK